MGGTEPLVIVMAYEHASSSPIGVLSAEVDPMASFWRSGEIRGRKGRGKQRKYKQRMGDWGSEEVVLWVYIHILAHPPTPTHLLKKHILLFT